MSLSDIQETFEQAYDTRDELIDVASRFLSNTQYVEGVNYNTERTSIETVELYLSHQEAYTRAINNWKNINEVRDKMNASIQGIRQELEEIREQHGKTQGYKKLRKKCGRLTDMYEELDKEIREIEKQLPIEERRKPEFNIEIPSESEIEPNPTQEEATQEL